MQSIQSLSTIEAQFDAYLQDQQQLSLKDLLSDQQLPKAHEMIIENQKKQQRGSFRGSAPSEKKSSGPASRLDDHRQDRGRPSDDGLPSSGQRTHGRKTFTERS